MAKNVIFLLDSYSKMIYFQIERAQMGEALSILDWWESVDGLPLYANLAQKTFMKMAITYELEIKTKVLFIHTKLMYIIYIQTLYSIPTNLLWKVLFQAMCVKQIVQPRCFYTAQTIIIILVGQIYHGFTGYIRPLATCKTMGEHCIPWERYGQQVSCFLSLWYNGWPVHPVHNVSAKFPFKEGVFHT